MCMLQSWQLKLQGSFISCFIGVGKTGVWATQAKSTDPSAPGSCTSTVQHNPNPEGVSTSICIFSDKTLKTVNYLLP